ncbi:M64 family metallopeptidase [Streptomyces caatingaensis]|uniref:Peptidase M64 n=1 Tax=Streptomyces caatingaensis TaxID=1678637 RepID=A0A0K9XKX2_9ACTN|nr:M64 family metallopeptidase [Streptomyces caatingaensis]KNB53995.1 hypothetical protein AC230_05420 [Streptomyces caatingaensis]
MPTRIRRHTGRRRWGGAVAVAALAAVTTLPAASAATPQRGHRVEYFTGPDGHPRHTTVPASPAPSAPLRPSVRGDGDVVPIVRNGPAGHRLDVVFIGDGYTAAQQGDFHAAVRAKWEKMSAVEPYASYRNLFNVWAVDAVSHDSGVSGDPGKDVVKDTALRSAFFCDGIERLLCVDTDRVEAYAAKAPAADLVVVLSHSAKYGGAGYNDVVSKAGYEGIATASSDHPRSDRIAVHETGHSLGKLADEYEYPDYGTYTGDEPAQANVSTLRAGDMAGRRAKWYRWLGRTSPDGGTVGAYEGGGYYPKGLFRPTENSVMRTLGREFNLPGAEAMIAGFHRHAAVLTSGLRTDRPVARTARITVRTSARTVVVRWYADGREVRAARGRTLVTPRSLGVPADGRRHRVTARATDTTAAVRDPKVRMSMQGELSWETELRTR